MTTQESFKGRIRARMEHTGERYAAARQSLLDQSPSSGGRQWVAQPEFSDDAVRAATGKGWNEWADLIESWPGHTEGHKAIAAHLHETTELDGWWAQGVTVSYERITGIRLPHQMSDGTFTANKSATMTIDATELRRILLDDGERDDLFPGFETELRSRPTSKAIRIGVGPGVALISLDEASGGRTKVTIAHEKLPTFEVVEEWKFYWADWLEAAAGT